ncbi:hypothetical protein P7C73_g1742, partial [Tremellales sp. Uapishka_1]
MSYDASNTDSSFVDKAAEIPETNIDADKEDRLAEESEATGKISKDEVEGLKDSIGGGEVLDDSEGYTRSSNADNNPMKQENEIDAAIDGLEE